MIRATQPRRSGRPGGFTLVELLVVLLILVLAVGVAAPRIGAGLEHARLKSATRQLASALRFARGRAVAEGGDVAVALDLKARHYRVEGRDRRYPLPDGVEVELETARSEITGERAGAIRFFPDGSSTGGKVTLLNESHRYAVNVNWLTGGVSVGE